MRFQATVGAVSLCRARNKLPSKRFWLETMPDTYPFGGGRNTELPSKMRVEFERDIFMANDNDRRKAPLKDTISESFFLVSLSVARSDHSDYIDGWGRFSLLRSIQATQL